jgi:excisionase family DNA binding protein
MSRRQDTSQEDSSRQERDEGGVNEIMTAAEVAAYYRRARHAIYIWVRSGKIPHRRLPGGKVQFRRSELERWWATLEGISVDDAVKNCVGNADSTMSAPPIPTASRGAGRGHPKRDYAVALRAIARGE